LRDSSEKLALSCTFAIYSGKPVLVEDERRITLDLDRKPDMVIDAKYKVESLIGEGGMGAVYKVHHLLLQKDMALKTFRSHNLSQDVWQRFQQEARSIARLKHKNIVEVFDFGFAEEGLPYYTMSLLSGESLAERLSRTGKIDASEALGIFLQVAQALAHAHQHHVVHRDIKPANIFLENNTGAKGGPPQVKIVDFGIAKLAEDNPAAESQSLTRVGTIFGSPLYMSPEQVQGVTVDQRSDIYSYGCALFETLTGEPPFMADNALATMMCHVNDSPARVRDVLPDATMSQRLDNLVARLLAKDPEQRYQSFSDVIEDLNYCLEDLSKNAQIVVDRASESNLDEVAAPAHEAELAEPESGAPRQKMMIAIVIAAVTGLAAWLGFHYFYPPLKPAQAGPARPTMIDGSQLPSVDRELDRHREAAVKIGKPFWQGRGQAGAFVFPDYALVGWFTEGDGVSTVTCRGRVSVYPHQNLVFHARDEFFKQPRLFTRFRGDDIDGLILEPPEDGDWSVDKFQFFEHLDHLRQIGLSKGDFDGRVIPHLEKFRRLRVLDIRKTKITGEDLARSKLITRLLDLRAENNPNMEPFFIAAAKSGVSCPLQYLTVNSCGLNDGDLKEIAKIKSLVFLNGSGGNVQGPGIKALAESSNVETMKLEANPIEPKFLKYFARFKRLKTLYIDGTSLSEGQKNSLRKCRPNFEVSFHGPAKQPDL
jgi:serine/threonine protein kinase